MRRRTRSLAAVRRPVASSSSRSVIARGENVARPRSAARSALVGIACALLRRQRSFLSTLSLL
eukprot:5217007-Prymnesium_polylepis.1